MTARTLTADEAEAYGRHVVQGRDLGFCQLGCGRPGQEWAHRLSRSRGGTWAPVNGLWLCSRHQVLTHREHDLSRACGWMVETGTHPSQVPALITTQVGPGWWWLDELDPTTGRPTGLFRLAEPEEIPPGMWSGTLAEALTQLHGRAVA